MSQSYRPGDNQDHVSNDLRVRYNLEQRPVQKTSVYFNPLYANTYIPTPVQQENFKLNNPSNINQDFLSDTLQPTNEELAKWEKIRSLVNKQGIIPNVGKLSGEVVRDFQEFTERKIMMNEYNEFENWMFQQISMTNDAERVWWEKKFPEFYYKKLKALEIRENIEHKANLLAIYGPRTEADYYDIYRTLSRNPLDNTSTYQTPSVNYITPGTTEATSTNNKKVFLNDKSLSNQQDKYEPFTKTSIIQNLTSPIFGPSTTVTTPFYIKTGKDIKTRYPLESNK